MEHISSTETEEKFVYLCSKLSEPQQRIFCELVKLLVLYPESFDDYKKMSPSDGGAPLWADVTAFIEKWKPQKTEVGA